MSRIDNSQKKALRLKREMDEIDKQHKRFIEMIQTEEKTRRKKGNLKTSDRQLNKLCTSYAKKGQEAYLRYHDHMNKEFNINNSDISFNNPKYQNGFCDKQYINDMYKNKKQEIAKSKADKKATKKTKK